MLKVGSLNQDQSNSIFVNSSAIELQPVVSAEWNQNLFNQPYTTVAGDGAKQTIVIYGGTSQNIVTGLLQYKNFVTNSFVLSSGSGNIVWDAVSLSGNAYKVVSYFKTDSALPVMINAYAQGSNTQFGSSSSEVNSFGWTKIETYIGGSNTDDIISDFVYTISANSLSTDLTSPTIYYTTPEVYQTTFFDYQYGSLWPTDSPFSYFRPGESYVPSGNNNYSFPADYRKINNQVLNNYSQTTYFPISPVIQNPTLTFATAPVPVYKNVLPSDMSPYKYFVSDPSSRSITGMYDKLISANKIVIKINTLMTIPTVQIVIKNGSNSTTLGSITPNQNGTIILYWNGSSWDTNKWSQMPHFNSDGSVSNYTSFDKITITQLSKTINTQFATYSNDNLNSDLNRMHLIEISPRLEIDLSDFVKDVTINKSLDSKNNFVPISSINTDDALITLSAIPIYSNNSPIPIFSSQSNLSTNILTNMLRKNIKFIVNFHIKSYFNGSSFVNQDSYVPGGVFYSDSWNETDIKDVAVQCYDITRYLQTAPVPDYVGNLKSVFDVITNILDLAGFSDYDYDSLYEICNDKTMPLDLAYFYCNSKDTTIQAALAEIFLAYQIGAYIDEYGIMRFKSLSKILSAQTSLLTIADSNIIESGYSITNKAKPGKISLRYQSPKIKQSLALQNASNADIKNSPSFIYTTSNDVLWKQESLDSVGFNYLNGQMLKTDNKFKININDYLDIFHTFSLNNNGYAIIENEVVSFVYKEYRLSDSVNSTTVSVKNDLELSAEINRFTKKYQSGLDVSDGSTKADYKVKVEPTGFITQVERGMFGTTPTDHSLVSSLSSKSLTEATADQYYSVSPSSSHTSIVNSQDSHPNNPSVNKIQVSANANSKTLIYPSNQTDIGYKTYSVKFDLNDTSTTTAGLFFNLNSITDAEGAYFVELIKFYTVDPIKPTVTGTAKSNIVVPSSLTGIEVGMNISANGIIPGTTITAINKPETGQIGINTLTLSNFNSSTVSGSATIGSYKYFIAIYQIVGGTESLIGWSDITGITTDIVNNFEKTLIKLGDSSNYVYSSTSDQAFQLKVIHYPNPDPMYPSDVTGEQTGEIVSVFLNNVEINGWQVLSSTATETTAHPWVSTDKNPITKRRQKLILTGGAPTLNSHFGFYTSTKPVDILGNIFPTVSSISINGSLREIYACEKPLKERSVNYYLQDREFLNGMIQGKNIASKYKTYIMQTNPEIIGVNVYDVQYTNPAGVSADIYWGGYLWYYFPGTLPADQAFHASQTVDDYALSFSTPINTGFRAKMAIANNSSHMVYLTHISDQLNQFTNNLTLWTHEIIAPSDPEIIEHITDPANISEVAQVDSSWIQSKEAAQKMLSVIEKGFEGFSKDTTVNIFGNPLIQVGDIITITYSLLGVKTRKYLVHSVSQKFNQGLKTTLVLNALDAGVTY